MYDYDKYPCALYYRLCVFIILHWKTRHSAVKKKAIILRNKVTVDSYPSTRNFNENPIAKW